MTAIEVLERDEQRAKALGPKTSPEDELLPPPTTAPAIVKGSRKRA
jgi:hypothetical protein